MPRKILSRAMGTLIVAAVSALFVACASTDNEAKAQSNEPSLKTEKTRERTEEILSRHDTNAVFTGTQEVVCNGLTALCPNECGSSGTLAVFKIESYNDYQKLGKYGDEKAETFTVMLRSTTGTSDVSPEIAERIRALNAGDKVHLVWEHVYVSEPDGGNFPARPIRKLEPSEK